MPWSNGQSCGGFREDQKGLFAVAPLSLQMESSGSETNFFRNCPATSMRNCLLYPECIVQFAFLLSCF